MATARKKQRVQVAESALSAGESHEKKSFDCVPPVSILKDTVANLPSVNPLPKTDKMAQLNLRRKTYFIHGADTSEENEPCVIHNTKKELSLNTDEKNRRLTYVVRSFPHEDPASPLLNCNSAKEMRHSEMEITAMQESADPEQPMVLQDSKPKKVVRKKKKDDSAPTLYKEPASIGSAENENESLISNAPAGDKPRKRGQKKKSASITKEVPVKTTELENGVEGKGNPLDELTSTVKAKSRKKRTEKPQGEEHKTDPTQSDLQKKPVKRGRKKNNA